MAKQTIHPADLATRFKLDELHKLSDDKKKRIEELEEKKRKEIEALEEKKKKEIEEIEKKGKKELQDLEQEKQKEIEEAEKLLTQAIEEAKIDERLWRETDEKVMRRGEVTETIENALQDEDARRLEQRAKEQQSNEYQPLGSRQNLNDQRPYDQGGQSEHRKKEQEIYQAATGEGNERLYKGTFISEADRAREKMSHEDTLDAIDSTRSTLKKFGYKTDR